MTVERKTSTVDRLALVHLWIYMWALVVFKSLGLVVSILEGIRRTLFTTIFLTGLRIFKTVVNLAFTPLHWIISKGNESATECQQTIQGEGLLQIQNSGANGKIKKSYQEEVMSLPGRVLKAFLRIIILSRAFKALFICADRILFAVESSLVFVRDAKDIVKFFRMYLRRLRRSLMKEVSSPKSAQKAHLRNVETFSVHVMKVFTMGRWGIYWIRRIIRGLSANPGRPITPPQYISPSRLLRVEETPPEQQVGTDCSTPEIEKTLRKVSDVSSDGVETIETLDHLDGYASSEDPDYTLSEEPATDSMEYQSDGSWQEVDSSEQLTPMNLAHHPLMEELDNHY